MAERVFADTNLFLRYFMNDDVAQADAAESLFRAAVQGNITLVTHHLIIAEIVWVMSKVYQQDRHTIRRQIMGILNTPGIEIESASVISQAVDLYAGKNIDFVDAYTAVWMRENGLTEVYTFDRRHFSRVSGLNVKAPGQ